MQGRDHGKRQGIARRRSVERQDRNRAAALFQDQVVGCGGSGKCCLVGHQDTSSFGVPPTSTERKEKAGGWAAGALYAIASAEAKTITGKARPGP
jgi:hypothetical protein